jgi:predicted AAA+ superfamily ATPase
MIINHMLARHLTTAILGALGDRPVVMLHGARQTGKTTLARTLTESHHPARYFTFDDASVLAAAQSDPAGFLAGLGGPVVLDEVQRAPELFVAIKASVDRDRRPGRFLLTGSANVLVVPQLCESLAGRMEILTLWPFSQGEIHSAADTFIDAVFADRLPRAVAGRVDRQDLVDRITTGGYPEVVSTIAPARRSAWFGSYVTAILQRDVRDMANIADLTALPRLLALIASRPMSVLNAADLARSLGLPQTTLKRYLALLRATFLVRLLPPWFVNIGKRLGKSPKVFLDDTGLASHLAGLDRTRLETDPTLLGGLLESFIVMELQKQAGWSHVTPGLFHFRSHDGREVDIVLEAPDGRVVGIEVKAAATVRSADFNGLRLLTEAAGRRFHRGIVLHTGHELVPFGEALHAVPVNAVWDWAAAGARLSRPRSQRRPAT